MSAAAALTAGAAGAWQRQRPLLLPALALWGWQEGVLGAALALALGIELPRLVRTRLEISQADFDRLWSFTSVLFLAVIFYLALAREGLDAVGALTGAPPGEDAPDGMHRLSGSALTFLRWLPFILYPFTAAVAWSRRTVLPLSTFSLYEQARARRQPQVAPPEWATRLMHPGYLYLGVTLFSASTTTAHSAAFLPLLLAALLLALWPLRNRDLARPGVVRAGAAAGHGGGVRRPQPSARRARRGRRWRSASCSTPAAGTARRPTSTRPAAPPPSARSARSSSRAPSSCASPPAMAPRPGCCARPASTTSTSRAGTVASSPFAAHEGMPAPRPDAATITIARAGGAVCPLALPGDFGGLLPPRIGLIEAGGLGALRLRGGQPLVVYTVAHGGAGSEVLTAGTGGAGMDWGPHPDDANNDHLVPYQREALTRIADQLGLGRHDPTDPHYDPHDACARLAHWFAAVFTYQTYQDQQSMQGPSSKHDPLLNFLEHSHAGHCEYFATATVLLLRAAGIPARYAVGWSVSERDGGRFLARARDAHAWTLVWDGRRWSDLDTTPASWLGAETRPRTWLEALRDLGDEAWYRFALWRQVGGRWQAGGVPRRHGGAGLDRLAPACAAAPGGARAPRRRRRRIRT